MKGQEKKSQYCDSEEGSTSSRFSLDISFGYPKRLPHACAPIASIVMAGQSA
jgi:hypothetical protein